jgi:hypothetical protein
MRPLLADQLSASGRLSFHPAPVANTNKGSLRPHLRLYEATLSQADEREDHHRNHTEQSPGVDCHLLEVISWAAGSGLLIMIHHFTPPHTQDALLGKPTRARRASAGWPCIGQRFGRMLQDLPLFSQRRTHQSLRHTQAGAVLASSRIGDDQSSYLQWVVIGPASLARHYVTVVIPNEQIHSALTATWALEGNFYHLVIHFIGHFGSPLGGVHRCLLTRAILF